MAAAALPPLTLAYCQQYNSIHLNQNYMFTLDQIKATHARVKSGADFPQYVADMNALGVLQYTQYVADGTTVYAGHDHKVASPAKYASFLIADMADTDQLQHHLKIHQAGKTDYLTFCGQAAEHGVEKWTVDTMALTCTYYDKSGNVILTEIIPAAK